MNKLGWKVPFRQVYCATLVECLRQTIWCHFVIRVWPNCINLGSDSLVPLYQRDPNLFHEQYKFMIDRVVQNREELAH